MKLVGILAAVLLTVGAAVALGGSSSGDHPSPVAINDVRLVSVDSCSELLDWYRTVATQTPSGALSGYGNGGVMFAEGGKAVSGAVPQASTGAARDSAAAAPAHSDTNVQERGVDEADTVKTNGRILVNATADRLEIVDLRGDAPKLVSTMPLEQGGTELLLAGDRVLTLTNAWRQDPNAPQPAGGGDQRIMIMPVQGTQVTVLTSIDVSDPAHPREVERRELEGAYRTARLTGSTAHIVLVAYPKIPTPGPDVYGPNDAVTQQNLEQWKTQAIASMTIEDWAPIADGDCSSVARTAQPEGLATTSILTMDAEGSLDILDTDSVVADANTVYASTDRLFIATSRWSEQRDPAGQVRTELHGFDISGPQTTYIGSGSVPGYLLNQFALSAEAGHLRVATTQEAPWSAQTDEQSQTHSSIAVLGERAGALTEVGRLDGLGVSERIQAVRYLGDTAYVVTFRQKDPLFVIDLSDPTAPRVAGELKVPGYSAYLHPIDGNRLLGVGQDATDDGQVLGTQIATFDVHDPAAPTRIDALRIDHGTSPVEYDHRAFLWWDATRTVVLPVQIFDPGVVEPMPAPVEPELCAPDAPCSSPGSSGAGTSSSGGASTRPSSARPFTGAVVFTVGDDGSLVERGRVTHDGRGEQPDAYFPVNRSLVVGDALYTISDGGVLKSDLSSLADQGFAPFPLPANQPPTGIAVPAEG